MNSLERQSAGVRRRKRMALAALPIGIAATAVVGVVAVLGATPTPEVGAAKANASNGAGAAHRTVEPILRVVGAYFTLQRSDDGVVQLRITEQYGKVDLARLQKELTKAGVPSRVLAGDPACRPRSTKNNSASGRVFEVSMDGESPLLTVRPAEIPAGQEIVVGFPHAMSGGPDALAVIMGALIDRGSSYCVPAPAR